jgi:cytochrome c oxidase subunit 1
MSDLARVVFSLLTFLVAIPSGVKVFNWIATMYKGAIKLEPPMLFALTFIFLFAIGGLTGLLNGALATDVNVHETTYVVGHFHYTMFGGTGVGLFAALLYWWPKMTGKMYNKRTIVVAWAHFFVGFNLLYFTMMVMGWLGMPRRYYTYLPQYQVYHVIATVGSWILVAGIFMFLGGLLASLWRGKKAEANPWGGSTLEWHTSSPPPLENFEAIPTVTHGPYHYKGGHPA